MIASRISPSKRSTSGLRAIQFPLLGLMRVVEERVPVADDGLGDQFGGLRRQARHAFDGGADGHDFDEAAADLVDEDFDADHGIGADGLRLGMDVPQAVGAGFINQLRQRVDFAPRQSAEEGPDPREMPKEYTDVPSNSRNGP